MPSTLHQITRTPSQWNDDFLAPMLALWQVGDSVLLLGEAASAYADPRLARFERCYVLSRDAATLGLHLVAAGCPCQLIDYHDWARLVLAHQKHLTWA